MGGDGTSVSARQYKVHVKEEAKVDVNPKWLAFERLTSCALTGQALSAPIVACQLGFQYNKEAILEYLLSKSENERYAHITGFKDLIACSAKWAIAENGVTTTPVITCPLTSVQVSGHQSFLVMRDCGCVCSLKAYKELSSSAATSCIICDKPLSDRYITKTDMVEGEHPYIPLADTNAIVDINRQVLALRKQQMPSKKKRKLVSDATDANKKKQQTLTDTTKQAIDKQVQENINDLRAKSDIYKNIFNKQE